MVAVDSDVLAAALNRFAPGHARASALLESLVNGEAHWALPWPAIHGFVRRVTHPHAVARPLSQANAWEFVRLLAESPAARVLGPGPGHLAAVAEVLAFVPREGPPHPELELVAVLREHGVAELISGDRRLRAYGFLRVRDPWGSVEAEAPAAARPRRYRRLAPRRPRDG